MKSQPKPIISPPIGLFFAIVATSTSSIFIRFAQTGAPSLAIAAWRLTISSLILLPLVIFRRRHEICSLTPKSIILLVVSGAFLCFHFASWISSLEFTSVASSVVLVSTSPLWVAIIAPLFLKEKLDRIVWIGLLVALAGCIIVGSSQACQANSSGITCQDMPTLLQGQAIWGNFLALAGAWFAAGYLMIGRRVRPGISLLTYTGIVYTSSAIGLLLLAVVSGTGLFGYRIDTMAWIACLALIPQLIGHSTYNWALRYLTAAFVSVGLLGEPVGSIILAYLILKEPPTILEAVGGIFILLGIYLAARAKGINT